VKNKSLPRRLPSLRGGDWFAGWLIAFKGVLLEGLEVWLVVAAFGLHRRAWVGSGAGALAALLVVVIAGLAVRLRCGACPRTPSSSRSGTSQLHRPRWQNGFAERLIGSIRRECVDHFVVLGEAHRSMRISVRSPPSVNTKVLWKI
jgi:hypothetical protein